ncbi:MAG TPA: asparagine synthase (glutamine-hydrolyzing) [Nitrospirota bacterium]|nr:asparagine synthase (glutamine-hydrolyzing) [Nitrospirota bacterium]HUL00821.1 asparagine synthase (glutamine-hydrolyzing) [Nitrospirota bacterium]
MCGIVAIFSYHKAAPAIDRSELISIRDRMLLRGPDDSGEWYSKDNRVALGHRRLAIIDLSENASQPMLNHDGSLIITFNGEIYNYRELRSDLEKKGFCFRSASDTEVLLNLYADKGQEMVHELRGMYAFAIWDQKNQGLFLARDPFGIKPLYYADDGKSFRAASQVKALLAGNAIGTAPEPAGHVGFFLWGHVPEPYTLYKCIRSLPAGSSLWIDNNGARKSKSFCNISDEIAKASIVEPKLDQADLDARLRDALLDTVLHHLIADVPVAVFLSSGLDSTTLTALAAEAVSGLNTVTLGFNEFKGTEHDETPLAERVAKQYGAKHQTIWVSQEDYFAEREQLLDAMDQPSIDGVNTYFVSLAAKKAGMKVALSGLGGDELFGSYPSFQQIPRMVRGFELFNRSPAFGRAMRMFTSPIFNRFTSPKYAGMFEYGGTWGGAYLLRRGLYMPWEITKSLDRDMAKEGLYELQTISRMEQTGENIHNKHLKVAALEMTWYMRNQLLRDSDWASMAHSIELRVPFVDIEFLRTVTPLLCTENKPDKRAMASTPERSLPREILTRKKTGFIVPVREWLSNNQEIISKRGLRGWAKYIYQQYWGTKKRILVLVTDAFGGNGGIAKFNRDLLNALCSDPGIIEVIAIPRLMSRPTEQPLPEKLTFETLGLNSKLKYFVTILRQIIRCRNFDMTICGHINLYPVAFLSTVISKSKLMLIIHGREAWKMHRSLIVNRYVHKADAVIAVSDYTRDLFTNWSGFNRQKTYVLHNCVDLNQFSPGPKSTRLLDRYGLNGKTVLMTFGRLDSSERAKGFDEVMDALCLLIDEIPNISYMIVGDGTDRERLEQKARSLHIHDRVVFTGFVTEAEKADHYRLSDVYVMPSRGEGFGIVFLEALACGVPVIASKKDGSREAVMNGKLGLLVDPGDREGLKKCILMSLSCPKRISHAELKLFSYTMFVRRCLQICDSVQ